MNRKQWLENRIKEINARFERMALKGRAVPVGMQRRLADHVKELRGVK